MRVLFVSGIDGFCHRYQVLHRTAQLAALGATTTVRHFSDPRLLGEVAGHDLLFLYRVPETARVRAALELAADLGTPRLAAIDDLIFVDDPGCLPVLDALSSAERDEWYAGVRRYRATIERCDAFVAPTEPLVQAADGLGRQAHLHRNAVAPAELELGRRARAAVAGVQREAPILGYFSGTPTHDEDFASIARALRDVLRAHRAARLLIVGPLCLPAELEPFTDRIERKALVDWHELPGLIAGTDVCLAPLCTERRFAAAKGEIKYLEAAAVGVPTVASATSAYRYAICDGDNGRLATTQDEWRRALDDLLREPHQRERLGAAARADVATRYTERVRARELQAIVDQVRGGLRRRAQTLPAPTADATFDVERGARTALEPDACPAFAAASPAGVSPPLPAGSRLVQRLRIARDGLLRIDVHTITYGQKFGHELRLALRRDDGALVRAATLPADEAPDRAWLALELDAPEPGSAGRTYTLEVAAEGARGGSAVSFGTTTRHAHQADFASDGGPATGALGPALLDGTPIGSALVVRGFADWRMAFRDAGGDLPAPPPVDRAEADAPAQRDRGRDAAAPGMVAGSPRP